MKKILSSVVVAGFITTAAIADASNIDWSNTSIGADIGTTGIGLTGVKQLGEYPNWAVRVGAHKLSRNYTTTDNDADYDFDLDLGDFQLMVDYHPWMTSFKVTMGVFYNGTDLKGKVTPRGTTYTFNGHTYTTSDIGYVDVKVDFDNTIAPYVGIGWDTSFNKPEKTWGFTFNIGVAYTGSAKANYTPTFGPLVPANTRQQIIDDLEVEKKSLQDDLDDYKYLPYISIGFNYKLN